MQGQVFDVVIVGSGAAGGTLAAHLARRGIGVAIVEGGPRVNTRTAFNTHAMPFDFPNRQIPTMRPGVEGFDSERSRGVGGKTMLWNAVALRFSQRDFKGRTHDGAGEDWPIDYADMAPYYEAIEREVGVCGNLDRLEDLPDGMFLPPVPMKCSDEIIKRAAARARRQADSRAQGDADRSPATTRPACHFCGNCMAGCDVAAKYNSADVHIEPAEKAGQVTVFSDCIVREVLVSDDNRATGVRYVHRVHKQEGEVRGRTRGRRVRLRPEHRAAADVDVAAVSRRTGQFERPAGATLHPALHGRHRVRPREPARQARDQRRGVPRSRLSPVVHAQAQTELRAQLRRAVQLPEPPAGGLGQDRRRVRPRLQGGSERGLSGLRSVHAIRRDAAERAIPSWI